MDRIDTLLIEPFFTIITPHAGGLDPDAFAAADVRARSAVDTAALAPIGPTERRVCYERALAQELAGMGHAYEMTYTVSRQALAELAELARRFRLILAASSVGLTRSMLERHGALAHFDHVVESATGWFDKPDPRFFDRIHVEAHFTPEATAHVGPWRYVDAVGAMQAGLVPILLTPVPVEGPRWPRVRALADISRGDVVPLAPSWFRSTTTEPSLRARQMVPELVDAILASPHDDAPRRVYADWLVERGDPRGEFIHVQCNLAIKERERGYYASRIAGYTEEKEREKALLREHELEWLLALGLPRARSGASRVGCTFVRGFVEKFEAANDQPLPAIPAALFRDSPILEITVRDIDVEAVRPHLDVPRIERLKLRGRGREEEGALVKVFGCAGLTRVRYLQIVGNRGALFGLRTAHLPALEELDLSHFEAADRAIENLLLAPACARLRSLRLSMIGMGGGDLDALLAGAPMATLRTLALECNRLGDDGARVIAAAPSMASVRELDLTGNDIGRSGVEALVRSPHLRSLTKLKMSGSLRVKLGEYENKLLIERFGDAVVL